MLDQDDIHPLFYGAPDTTEFRKLRKRIVRLTREAIETYGMVRAGERWLVCLSGGKDSYTLLAALTELKWRGLLPVEMLACNLDQGQPGFPATVLPEFLTRMGVPHRIESATPIRSWWTRCRRRRPIARSARGSDGATSTGSPGRRGARRWCWASPGRHHRDVPAQPLSWRQAGGDAAEAPNDEATSCAPAARARAGGGLRAVREGDGLSDHPVRSLRQPGRAAARGDQAHGRRVGGASPGRRQILFRALARAKPSHLLDPALFDFKGL